MEVNSEKIKIREMTDILVTRFAFISGMFFNTFLKESLYDNYL